MRHIESLIFTFHFHFYDSKKQGFGFAAYWQDVKQPDGSISISLEEHVRHDEKMDSENGDMEEQRRMGRKSKTGSTLRENCLGFGVALCGAPQ